MRITRRSSGPRREFSSGANTWRLCNSVAYIRIRAGREPTVSILWPCRGKSEAITLGFYPGLPTRRRAGSRGLRISVANKRVKRKTTRRIEWRTLRLQRIKRGLRFFHRLAFLHRVSPSIYRRLSVRCPPPRKTPGEERSTFTPWIFHVEEHTAEIESARYPY